MKRGGSPIATHDLDDIRESVKEWWEQSPRELLLSEWNYDESQVDHLEEATEMIMTLEIKDWQYTLEEMRDLWQWECLQGF